VTYNIRTVDVTATAGTDYVRRVLLGETIAAGESSRRFFVTLTGDTAVEGDETFEVRATSIVGAKGGDTIAIGTLVDDDVAAPTGVDGPPPAKPAPQPRPAARDDRFLLRENAPAATLDVLANDVFGAAALAGGSLAVSETGRGHATVDDRGTASAADDRIVYRVPPDAAGADAFAYRLCDGDGACVEALAEVVIRPALDVDAFGTAADGTADVALAGLRALPSATYAATALVAPTVATPVLAVDPTPATPWDADGAGTATVLGELPAAAAPVAWTLLVDAQGLGGDVDLYLGLDLDGDGRPDRDEVRCTAAMSPEAERCELALHGRADAAVRYWVVAHNRAATDQAARLERFAVPMAAGDGTLAASGPGTVPAGAPFALRIDWNDPTLAPGGARVGYVRLEVDGEPAGTFPVRIDRRAAPAK
jgi:hypothetical protein